MGNSVSGIGGFDWPEWNQLRQVVEAGIPLDVSAFKDELLRFSRTYRTSRRSGAYLWYALRYQVAKRLRRRPNPDDLAELAAAAWPNFSRLVVGDQIVLTDLFATVFELRDGTPQTTGAMLIVNGAAALSVLVSQSADLDEIESHLVPWYNENGSEFAALNPTENRGPEPAAFT